MENECGREMEWNVAVWRAKIQVLNCIKLEVAMDASDDDTFEEAHDPVLQCALLSIVILE